MRHILGSAAAALIIITFAHCNNNTTTSAKDDMASALNADSLAHHIAILSGDDFMGRKPFTEGETKTIKYLQEQFRSVGLEPGDGDSYLQEVPMVKITTNAAPTMRVRSAKSNF